MSDYQIPYASEMGAESKPQEHKTFADRAGDALHSAAYSGLQSPVTGILQIVDNAAGTELAPNLQFIQNPEESDTFSLDWHIKHAASAAGMILPFILARKGAKRLLRSSADDILKLNGGMAKHWKTLAVKEGALSGFLYESLLVPSYNSNGGSLFESRFKQGIVGAATFGTLTKASIGARAWTSSLAKSSNAALFLDNSVAATTLAGLPAGLVSANSTSLLNEGKLATGKQSIESAYAMSFVGLSLSAAHQLSVTEALTGPAPKSGTLNNRVVDLLDKTQLPQRVAQIKDGARNKIRNAQTAMETFADNLALGMNPHGQLAYATAGNGARMPLMMEAQNASAKPLRMEIHEVDSGTGGGKPKRTSTLHEELGGHRDNIVPEKDVIRASDLGETAKAADVLRYHSLPEVADFVESSKRWRNLELNPDNTFHGNDALLVVEVKPSSKYPEGAMLKVVMPEGGWERDWGHRPGDAKLLSPVEEVDLGSGGTAYLYLQELVDVRSRYESQLLNEYFRGLEGKDLEFEEPGPNPNKQFGISQRTGRLVLIDYPSVGKPGHMRTLTELTQGADFFEREYDAENRGMRNVEAEAEFDRLKELDHSERDLARQRVKETRELDETQRDILEQLTSGVTAKEAAEYLALMRGEYTADGEINVSKVMPEIEAIIRMAKEEGYDID